MAVVPVNFGVRVEHDSPAAQALEVGFGRYGVKKRWDWTTMLCIGWIWFGLGKGIVF